MKMSEGWSRINEALKDFKFQFEDGVSSLTILNQKSKNIILNESKTMIFLIKEMADALEAAEGHGDSRTCAIVDSALKKFKEWK